MSLHDASDNVWLMQNMVTVKLQVIEKVKWKKIEKRSLQTTCRLIKIFKSCGLSTT